MVAILKQKNVCKSGGITREGIYEKNERGV